jgi:ATP-dependent Clp protease ATP-binding subunit ClpA
LNKEDMGNIVDKFLRETNKNLMKKGVVIAIDDDVRNFIIEEAIKLEMGGRPVKRLLTEHIEEKLVDEILYGKLENGGNVKVTMKNKEICFEFDNFNIFS